MKTTIFEGCIGQNHYFGRSWDFPEQRKNIPTDGNEQNYAQNNENAWGILCLVMLNIAKQENVEKPHNLQYLKRKCKNLVPRKPSILEAKIIALRTEIVLTKKDAK